MTRPTSSNEIRRAFLDFFRQKDHTFVPSSSLIPEDDPTLLFTNAGMNQFKPVLLGAEKRPYVRAVNSQKCMRVSGKHNDLEAVGRDGRHHTFFEMLGNWSFGDYYKREAIVWAWEFLTERMGLDAGKMLVSVYKDDDESYGIWKDEVGIPPERIHRLGDISKGDEENFWSMGETGPCGPCTEIHYDQGEEVARGDDRPLGENESDRYLEIWNLVFIQYDRDEKGELKPLPLRSVDTGMGLERLVALVNGVTSNYETDLFAPIIEWVAERSQRSIDDEDDRVSMQVIADHVRALTFAVADGGRPGNDGRGYVLRRILRRAARHGRRLGFTEPFLYQAAQRVIEMMGDHYRELVDAREHITRVIRTEEERFNQTLDRGLILFEEAAGRAKERFDREGGPGAAETRRGQGATEDATSASAGGGDDRPAISGEDAFKLHDTYGFPLDLTQVMAEEKGMTVDVAGFEKAMEQQRARARSASRFETTERGEAWTWLDGEPGAERAAARFVGYEVLQTECRLLGFRRVDDDTWEVVIDPTPFYAESGGQVGDTGVIEGEGLKLQVLDTQISSAGNVCRVRVLEGGLDRGEWAGKVLQARVDEERRRAIMRNHTATHLLHSALRRHLSEEATQAGSLVSPEHLRFDFHHDGALGRELLDAIEREVNERILQDLPVVKHVDVPIDEARKMGAIAIFGEKYGERVRVVQVDDYSVEFCGGTHCDHTGEIQLVKVTGESAVAAGVRRIEAITGAAAVESFAHDRDIVLALGEELSSRPDELLERVRTLRTELKQLQHELDRARREQAGGQADGLLQHAVEIDGMRVIAAQVEVSGREALLEMGDRLREKLGSGAAVLAAELDGKVAFIAVVTDDLIAQRGLKAGDLVKKVAAIAGGGGGGRPHLAQAGGKDPAKIPEAVAAVAGIVEELASRN